MFEAQQNKIYLNHSPKKVLFLTLRCFSLTGGVENVCKSICYHYNQQHQQKAIQFQMISLYDEVADERYLQATLFKGFGGKRLPALFAAVITGIQQDVVILSHINLSLFGLIIKTLSPKTKLVLWAHGIEVWRPINAIKKRFLKIADQIIAVSQYTAKSLSAWHQVQPKKVEVVPNALDPYYAFPKIADQRAAVIAKYKLMTNVPIFMAVCRIKASEKHKNYGLVIEALADLKKEGFRSYYFLCGKYEVEEQQRLIHLAQSKHYEKELFLTGFSSEANIAELQQAAKAFVLPSSKEGFGLVFIEAQAAGLRIIAGNKDGSVETVKDDLAGQLIDPVNVVELKNALRQAMLSPSTLSERKQIQENCKKHFSFQKFQEQLQQLVA